jgi:hypothetical protein
VSGGGSGELCQWRQAASASTAWLSVRRRRGRRKAWLGEL